MVKRAHFVDRPVRRADVDTLAVDAWVHIQHILWQSHNPGSFIPGGELDQVARRYRESTKKDPLRPGLDMLFDSGLSYREAKPEILASSLRGLFAVDSGHGECCGEDLRAALSKAESDARRELDRRQLSWTVGQRVAVWEGSADDATVECSHYVGKVESVTKGITVRPDWYSVYPRVTAFDKGGSAIGTGGIPWRIWPVTDRDEEDAWRKHTIESILKAGIQPHYYKTDVLDRVAELLKSAGACYATEAEANSDEPSPEWAAVRARKTERDAAHEAEMQAWAAGRSARG